MVFFMALMFNRIIKKTVMKNLDILPSSLVLSRMDVELSKREEHPYFTLLNLLGHIKKKL